MLELETGSDPSPSGTDPEGGAVTLIGPFRATFGGGVIGNTAGSGPVVGGSSPPPEREAAFGAVATLTAAPTTLINGSGTSGVVQAPFV